MHWSAGNDRTAAQVLQTQHFIGSPESLHAVPHEHNAGQFSEGLSDVEVTERADLKKRDAQSLRKGLRMFGGHLTLIGQMKPVAHQDLGDTWCMLINLFNPSVDAVERPPVCDVINKDDSLCSSGIGAEYGTESALS